MDAKLVTPKFNPNLITRAYGDNLSNGSAKSGAGDHQIPTALFFAHDSARVTAPIGEPILSGEYPQMDENWDFWMSSTNPNSHRLTDHDKCVVESFNHIIRHQNVAAALLEQLLEYHQANDGDENTQVVMASVFTALQYIDTVNDSSKSALDDFGQKWKHNAVQFELNRRFAHTHNPDDESMTASPGIYDKYKIQVNAYGETSVCKRDCGQLVPKPVVVKPKKQVPQLRQAANACGPCSRPPSKRTRKWWASPTRNCPRRGSCRNPMSALGRSNAPSLEDRRSIQIVSQAPRPHLSQRVPKTSWSHASPKCAHLWFPGKGTRNMAPQVPGLFYSCKLQTNIAWWKMPQHFTSKKVLRWVEYGVKVDFKKGPPFAPKPSAPKFVDPQDVDFAIQDLLKGRHIGAYQDLAPGGDQFLSRSRVHTPPGKGKQSIIHALCSLNDATTKRQTTYEDLRMLKSVVRPQTGC